MKNVLEAHFCGWCQCTALSPQLMVALKSARRLTISAARCSAKRCLSSGVTEVTLVSPLGCRTQGLPRLKGGSVTSLCHPARSCARGAHSVKAALDVEVVQVALKRPTVGHFLAAGDARLRDRREHEALGEAVLGCIRATCPAESSVRIARWCSSEKTPVRFWGLSEVMR